MQSVLAGYINAEYIQRYCINLGSLSSLRMVWQVFVGFFLQDFTFSYLYVAQFSAHACSYM